MRHITLGHVFDIRVGVHASWIAGFAFVTVALAGTLAALPRIPAFGVAAFGAIVIFAGVIAHELAHALTARRFGVRTAAITLFVFGGVATLESEPPSPRAELTIALAGPAMSAVIAALAFGALTLCVRFASGAAGDAACSVAADVAFTNLALAVFNLIPAYPMDGGRVLRAVVWRARGDRSAATGAAALAGVVIAACFVVFAASAAVVFRSWQNLWYVLVGAFLLRASWTGFRESRYAEQRERTGRIVGEAA